VPKKVTVLETVDRLEAEAALTEFDAEPALDCWVLLCGQKIREVVVGENMNWLFQAWLQALGFAPGHTAYYRHTDYLPFVDKLGITFVTLVNRMSQHKMTSYEVKRLMMVGWYAEVRRHLAERYGWVIEAMSWDSCGGSFPEPLSDAFICRNCQQLVEQPHHCLVELLAVARAQYIERGYVYDGHISVRFVERELGVDGEVALDMLFSAVEQGLLERRNCDALSFCLPAAERLSLIEDNNLSEVWEEKAPFHYPNDPVCGAIAAVRKEMGNTSLCG
jgi:hypothetical protein